MSASRPTVDLIRGACGGGGLVVFSALELAGKVQIKKHIFSMYF